MEMSGQQAAKTHVIEVVPVEKMDTPTGLFTWRCACGKTGRDTGMIGSEAQASRAGGHHADAKNK